jgi:hypothetical protein
MAQVTIWKNLAPGLVRQRVVIEALTPTLVDDKTMADFLVQLSKLLGMRPLGAPYTYPAEDAGYGGWIHWISSGCHIYSYTAHWTRVGMPMITVDAYTCKPFSAAAAADFTKEYFGATDIVWREI